MTHDQVYYILEGKTHLVLPASREEYEEWIDRVGSIGRLVAQTDFREDWNSDLVVTTEFVGLVQNTTDMSSDSETTLFHTLVFGGKQPGVVEKYWSWDEAAAGHQRWVERGRKALQYHRQRRERMGQA